MTANSTPRLLLMKPVSTDPFTPDDFVDTFTKLDNAPGVTPVANYAALPSGLSSAQHGSQFIETDNYAQWMWNKPGAAAGYWVRTNCLGLLQRSTQPSDVTTSATTDAAAATLINATVTAPGNRALAVTYFNGDLTNSVISYGTASGSKLNLLVNNSVVKTSVQNATYFFPSFFFGGGTGMDSTGLLLHVIDPPNPGTSISLKVKLRINNSAYGGGTVTAPAGGELLVWEI